MTIMRRRENTNKSLPTTLYKPKADFVATYILRSRTKNNPRTIRTKSGKHVVRKFPAEFNLQYLKSHFPAAQDPVYRGIPKLSRLDSHRLDSQPVRITATPVRSTQPPYTSVPVDQWLRTSLQHLPLCRCLRSYLPERTQAYWHNGFVGAIFF